jgi:hypothetical protein
MIATRALISPLALFGVAAVGATAALVPMTAPGSGSAADMVSSDAALAAAIARAKGAATIRVAPGRYGPLQIGKSDRVGQLTIESADPQRPASFSRLVIAGTYDVTVRNVAVERRSGEPLMTELIFLRNAQRLVLDGLQVTGPREAERGREYGMMIRGVEDVRIANSTFSGTRYGIGMLQSRGVTLERNELFDLETDGIRGGGVNELRIIGNVLGRFTPKAGAHPDGIQLWSTREKVPAVDIEIRDNLIVRDGGGIVQGVFVRDTKLQLPFQKLRITGNLVIGGMYNGVAVQGATGAVVTGNEVIAMPDQKSWIRVQGVQGGELADNRAMEFVIKDSSVQQSRNKRIGPMRRDFFKPIQLWWRARAETLGTPGPYARQLMGPTGTVDPSAS